MHELPVTQNLLDIVRGKAREIDAKKVSQINVVVGELSGVESDCVKFYFDILKKDYDLEDAALSFEKIASLLKCRSCHKEFHSEDMPWSCPDCGSFNLEILKGSECYVESIEVD